MKRKMKKIKKTDRRKKIGERGNEGELLCAGQLAQHDKNSFNYRKASPP